MSSSEGLIKTSEFYLKTRNFESCRNYILNSPLYHPTNLTATKILTIINVLSSKNTYTRPDYYSILSLSRFTESHRLIKTRFKTLATLLNPNTNAISLASEAYKLVIEAYSVVSNGLEKKKFDDWLKICEDSEKNEEGGFWTVCPYCYYVYEYERVYEGCILRCQNGECRKGFTGVGIKGPPEEVAASGTYLCLGFKEFGFKGFSTWSPFLRDLEENEKEKEVLKRNGNGNENEVLTRTGNGNENEKEKKVLKRNGNGNDKEKEKEYEEKMGFKRRKVVGVYAKKVMGKGVKVKTVVDEDFGSSQSDV